MVFSNIMKTTFSDIKNFITQQLRPTPTLCAFLEDERNNGVNVPKTYFTRVVNTGPNKEHPINPAANMGDFKEITYYLDIQSLPQSVREKEFRKRFKLGPKYSIPTTLEEDKFGVFMSQFGNVEYYQSSDNARNYNTELMATYTDQISGSNVIVTPNTWTLNHNYLEQAARFHYYPKSAKINVLVTHPGWQRLGLFTDAKSIMYPDIKAAGHTHAWVICNATHAVKNFPGARFYAPNPRHCIDYCRQGLDKYIYEDNIRELDDIERNAVAEAVDPTGSFAKSGGYRFPI